MSVCKTCGGTKQVKRLGVKAAKAGHKGAKVCNRCDGLGRVTAAGRPSKRESSKPCFLCEGGGYVKDTVTKAPCYSCRATGWKHDYERGIRIEAERRTETMSYEFARAWIEDSAVAVVRREGGQTWAEANLGLGLYSRTDYGTAWKCEDVDVAKDVVAEILSSPPQFTKVMDHDTGEVGNTIIVLLNKSGYSVIVPKARLLGALPPTYTADLLMSEVS